MKVILFLLSLCVVTLATTENESYENYKLLNIVVRSQSDAAVIMQAEELGGDLWSRGLYRFANATMMVSPQLLVPITQLFKSKGLVFWVSNENLQKTIDEEHERNMEASRNGDIVGTFARYADIESWLKTKATQCGNNCVLETIGRSYEGRNLYAFRFGKDIKTGVTLPRIFTESTFHAREWLAQAAHIYIIDQLVSKFGQDAAITTAFSSVEITFVVAANPDGYDYSHLSSNTRYWRKTRSLNAGTTCVGVDPNRNFDFQFGGRGSSNDPCSDGYRGTRAFSEPETLAVSNYILQYKDSIKAYISQHTYGKLILIPYGYKHNELPPDFNELLEAGNAMAGAIKAATNLVYRVGNSAELYGVAAGASDDWAKGAANIKYSYTIELRGNGFVVPPSEIAPAGTELLAAFTTLASYIK